MRFIKHKLFNLSYSTLILALLGVSYFILSSSKPTSRNPDSTQATVFETSWETGSFNTGFNFVEYCCAHSTRIVEGISYLGNKSARFELRNDDPTVEFGSNRVELRYNIGTNHWIRWAYYLPTDSNQLDHLNYISGQWKEGTGGIQTGGGSPPLAVVVNGNYLIMYRRWAYAGSTNSETNLSRDTIGTLDRGQWVRLVINYEPSHTTSGKVQVWKNGVKVLDITGRNYYEGATAPYFKLGVYRWVWASAGNGGSIVPYYVGYFDGFKVGSNTETFETMAFPEDLEPEPEPEPQPSKGLPIRSGRFKLRKST